MALQSGFNAYFSMNRIRQEWIMASSFVARSVFLATVLAIATTPVVSGAQTDSAPTENETIKDTSTADEPSSPETPKGTESQASPPSEGVSSASPPQSTDRKTDIVDTPAPDATDPEQVKTSDGAAPVGEAAPTDVTETSPPPETSSRPNIPNDKVEATESEATTSQTKESSNPPSPKKIDSPLTIASWGGAYARSQHLAYAEPFKAETGTKIEMVVHGGRATAINQLSAADKHGWDVVDLGSQQVAAACEAGHLEKLNHREFLEADNGSAVLDDFLPGALHDCGIASVAWSSVIAFDTRAFKKRKPTRAKDFFDLKRFPGKRGLRQEPKYALELALMADGVPAADVYKVLATETGIERAFAKLDQIKDSIVWWDRGHDPLRLIREKQVAMTTAFSGRVFHSVVMENVPAVILWDSQIYDTDYWAIPKGAANKEKAQRFISFALQPERLAAQAQWHPYGPMRKSALPLLVKHAEADVALAPFIPTTDKNFKTALKLDNVWWEANKAVLTKRFDAWQAGETLEDDSAKTE